MLDAVCVRWLQHPERDVCTVLMVGDVLSSIIARPLLPVHRSAARLCCAPAAVMALPLAEALCLQLGMCAVLLLLAWQEPAPLDQPL